MFSRHDSLAGDLDARTARFVADSQVPRGGARSKAR
jgi:hypothetical protein